MNKLIGQHLIIGISGLELTSNERDFIIDNNIGGVVLFSRNYKTPTQLHALCSSIQSLRHKMKDKAPLFIGIDQEGGRVLRLKEPFTAWPPLKKIGDLDNSTISFLFTQKMGMELMAVGINLDFAPCIDVFTNPKNTVIGDRSVGTTAELVDKHTSALIRGYIKSGILCCAKHFPGHGNTLLDSHEDLPVELEADFESLEKLALIPFKKAFKSRVDMVMTAHIRFPKIDPDWPVTLSEIFIKQKIRSDYRFRGLVITDDLDMKALTKNYSKEDIPVRALMAGADILLYCNEPESPVVAIEAITSAVAQGKLSKEALMASSQHIMDVKRQKLVTPDPMPLNEALSLVGHDYHRDLSMAIASGVVPPNLLGE